MKKLKVITAIGTRPELIRLSRVIDLLDKNLNHVLVHTGQNYNYELNQIFFKDMSLRKPDFENRGASLKDSRTKLFYRIYSERAID